MPIVRINVHKCIQDSQEYGSTDEHMVSRVFFNVEVDGMKKGEDFCDIKQIVGSSYSSENIEVTRPSQYRGPYDHQVFSDEITGYFCKMVNSSGAVISLGDSRSVRMRNNAFNFPYHFEFDAEAPGTGW